MERTYREAALDGSVEEAVCLLLCEPLTVRQRIRVIDVAMGMKHHYMTREKARHKLDTLHLLTEEEE